MMGKEAALFVTSGTQGNLVGILAHTTPGQEMICGEGTHTYLSEVGGPSRLGGLSVRTVPPVKGVLDPARVEAGIRPDNIHYPVTGLINVEQPWSGYVMPLENLSAIAAIGRRHGIPLHMDGARIFNAAIALGVPASTLAGYVDSVQFCLSKGLAAPVGSILAGPRDLIARARRYRKMVGGGMRQAGIIAAAGLYSLEHMVDRLREDHDNARRLAAGLRRLSGLRVDRDEVQMNIFFVDLVTEALTPAQFTAALKERGVLISTPYGAGRTMRLVTHYGITSADIDAALAAIEQVLATAPVAAAVG
jgi:threonine aldolase